MHALGENSAPFDRLVDCYRPDPSEDAVHCFLVVACLHHEFSAANGAAPRGHLHFVSDVHLIEVELHDADDGVIILASGINPSVVH